MLAKENFASIDNCRWGEDFHEKLQSVNQTCLVNGSITHIEILCLGVTLNQSVKKLVFFCRMIIS